MTKIKIATDSTADIPKSFYEELNISVLPLTILAGEKEYRDGVDITPSEFYKIIDASKQLPVSSQVACPLEALKDIYNMMSQDTTKIRARIKGAEHEDMLTLTDGYMTAWFLYHLQGDEEAGAVFFGDNAEILNNANWQDVQKNR